MDANHAGPKRKEREAELEENPERDMEVGWRSSEEAEVWWWWLWCRIAGRGRSHCESSRLLLTSAPRFNDLRMTIFLASQDRWYDGSQGGNLEERVQLYNDPGELSDKAKKEEELMVAYYTYLPFAYCFRDLHSMGSPVLRRCKKFWLHWHHRRGRRFKLDVDHDDEAGHKRKEKVEDPASHCTCLPSVPISRWPSLPRL